MKTFKDPYREAYKEVERNERILEEGKKRGYNVFKLNDETRKICLANRKKKPRPIDGRFSDHVEKYY